MGGVLVTRALAVGVKGANAWCIFTVVVLMILRCEDDAFDDQLDA